MAGTVAKLVFPHNVGPNGDGFHTSRTTKVTRNMEEDDILNQLSDSNFSRRAEILDQLRNAARKNGGRLPFQDQKAIFRGFAMALSDNDWDVRHHCIQLVHELIPHIGDELDECMAIILPRLVPNMGDSKITIRRAVIQTLHVYMKHTYDIQQTFKAIVQHGLDNSQSRVRKEVIIALPMMFTPDFSEEDFFDITQSLAKKLLDTSDSSIQQHALLSLDKIRNLVGDKTFTMYQQKLSPPLRKYYNKLTGRTEGDVPYSSSSNSSRNDVSSFTPGDSVAFTTSVDNYTGTESTSSQGTRIHVPSSGGKLEFGVIPSHIMEKLKESNFRARAQAVEELKVVLKDMSDVNVQRMSPHVLNFITFLTGLLDDSNFKITTVTLEILGLLVKRQGPSISAHLKALVGALSKRMGDNKIVIRQAIMKVIMQLMQVLSPKHVLSVICENLSNRNSRVRQETLNIVIASLLTFPSYDFDLAELCDVVAPTLIDTKRQVRQAALECYAAIASNLGPGKLQPLVSSVDSVELSYEGDGVMAAVQARLARRILPKLNADGLVDYATPVPSSAGSRSSSVNLPPGADIEWILSAAGGSNGSARSNRSDIEIESVTSSARTTPAPPPLGESPSHGPTPRRSSGRGKGRLPWEETEVTYENGYNNQGNNKLPRQKQLANSSSNPRDQSPPDTGSYRQMYLNQKFKKQTSEQPATQPFSVYNASRDDESHSAFSTPRNNDDSSRMTFSSNSWPDDPGKSNKRLLEPITDNENEQETDHSPIPMKPALARGTSSRSSSKRKVPPIPVSEKIRTERQDSSDSARDSALDDFSDDTNRDEMQHSLRQIRNSATRKKVDKIFEVLDTQHKKMQVSRSPSPPDTFAESGIYSTASTMRSNVDEPDHANPTPVKKGLDSLSRDQEITFPLKPKIHHTKSQRVVRKKKTNRRISENLSNHATSSESGLQVHKKKAQDDVASQTKHRSYDFQDDNPESEGKERSYKVSFSPEPVSLAEEQMKKRIQKIPTQSPCPKEITSTSDARHILPELSRLPPKQAFRENSLTKVASVPEALAEVDYDKWRNQAFVDGKNRKAKKLSNEANMSKKSKHRGAFHGKKVLPEILSGRCDKSDEKELSAKCVVTEDVNPVIKNSVKHPLGNIRKNTAQNISKQVESYSKDDDVAIKSDEEVTPKTQHSEKVEDEVKNINFTEEKEAEKQGVHKKSSNLPLFNFKEFREKRRKEKSTMSKKLLPIPEQEILRIEATDDQVDPKKKAKKVPYKSGKAGRKLVKEKEVVVGLVPDKELQDNKIMGYCNCSRSQPVYFASNDTFSPIKRRQRIRRYLKECTKLPRYIEIYRKYQAGNINNCVWHLMSSFCYNGELVEDNAVPDKTGLKEQDEDVQKENSNIDDNKHGQSAFIMKNKSLTNSSKSCKPGLNTGKSHLIESAVEMPPNHDGHQKQEEMPQNTIREIQKKAENPFESKPRLARKASQAKADRETTKPAPKDSKSNSSLASSSVAHLDFSPHGGVTFKENPGVNLQMVGMGFEHDAQPAKPKQNTYGAAKARERRRVTKDLKSPSSISSSSSTSLQSQHSTSSQQSEEEITTKTTTSPVVVGYGMFDGPVLPNDQVVGTPPDRREKQRTKPPAAPVHEAEAHHPALGAIYGVSVKQNSIDKEDPDDDDDDVNAIAISQATRANMQLKVQQKKEEAERQRQEKERLRQQRELAEKQRKQEAAERQRKLEAAERQRKQEAAAEIQREKERQQHRLRRLSDQPDVDISGLAVSGSGSQQQTLNGQAGAVSHGNPATPKPPPATTKPATSTPFNKRKVKPVAEERTPASAKSSSEPESPDQLKPFKEPQKALDEALKGIGQETWDVKCSSINSLRRLAAHHPEVLCTSQLHTINLALISEVKNLRSQVSRLAIMCLGEMFHRLRKNMEADLDQVSGVLLAKAGESNNFIRDDMDQALSYMVEGTTPQRAMLALIVGGASHRNAAVRKTTSYFLMPIVEKLGPGRLLSGIKDVTDRILPVAANFVMDGNPETRYNGLKIFHLLMSHEDFDRVLNKHLPQTTLRNISDKLENLKRKGLGDPPTENGSAKNRRSGHGSRVSSSVRYNSASTSGTDSTPTSSKHRSAMPRTDESTMEEIKSYGALMTAADWRERQRGITRMHQMISQNPTIVGANLVKVFDKFVPCLKDSNSKVNLFALQTMEKITKSLAEYIGTVINFTIQTVASNLSSKNKDIYEAACMVLDEFMNSLDETILLQPFCNQAQNGNSRIKPDMVDRVAYLVNCVYPVRPKQVILHVLPLLWHLLSTVSQSGANAGGGGAAGNIRTSTNHLVHALLSQMGDSLMEYTKGNSSINPRMMQCLQEMVENPAVDD